MSSTLVRLGRWPSVVPTVLYGAETSVHEHVEGHRERGEEPMRRPTRKDTCLCSIKGLPLGCSSTVVRAGLRCPSAPCLSASGGTRPDSNCLRPVRALHGERAFPFARAKIEAGLAFLAVQANQRFPSRAKERKPMIRVFAAIMVLA